MKTTKTKSIIAALFLTTGIFAQSKQSIAVLNIDSKGVVNDSKEMGYLVRLELEKTKVYTVLDKYEVNDVLSANKIDISNCYAKTCLVETGKLLKVDKMLSGSVERLGEKIVVSLRLIDVASGNVEKTEATEYINLPEIQKMVAVSVQKMVGQEPDPVMVKLLIDYDVPIESPKNTLKLNGPRMGFATTVGPAYDVITGPNKSKGEFGMFPATFQFGWQQEFQYISAGNFQALVENLMMVSGLESGRFIPSYSPMLGFRFGKGAWEFGFGPNFRLVRKAEGFYDTQGKMADASLGRNQGDWYLTNQWDVKDTAGVLTKNPYQKESRLDSRGNITLSTGLVIAIGKTFRSGYLNIPVNVYIAPRTDGTTIGVTCGFNIQKKKKVE
jgi:hypothetical protein